tara:strand:+ start:3796 stop:4032 length:237 start_codon:yes stop_codon:yes gene_type:complete
MVNKKNVKTVKIETLELGTKFKTPSGTQGFLVEKGIGSVTVLIHKVPKKREFYNDDGSLDTYWTGKQRWSPDTEVESE